MGRIFVVDLEGRSYRCKFCKTHLALADELVSRVIFSLSSFFHYSIIKYPISNYKLKLYIFSHFTAEEGRPTFSITCKLLLLLLLHCSITIIKSEERMKSVDGQSECYSGSWRGEDDDFWNAYCCWCFLLLLWPLTRLEICNLPFLSFSLSKTIIIFITMFLEFSDGIGDCPRREPEI